MAAAAASTSAAAPAAPVVVALLLGQPESPAMLAIVAMIKNPRVFRMSASGSQRQRDSQPNLSGSATNAPRHGDKMSHPTNWEVCHAMGRRRRPNRRNMLKPSVNRAVRRASIGMLVLLIGALVSCKAERPAAADGVGRALSRSDKRADEAGNMPKMGPCAAAIPPPFAAIEKLATTPEPVRVLVYGQSISKQTWWRKTEAWLRATYPNGNLIMEMHAHGGCAAQCLIGHEAWSEDGTQFNRLPDDVFAFKPDLVIFHVLGDHIDYGYIMRAFEQGCAAFDDYRTHDGFDVPNVHCTARQRALERGYKEPEVLVQDDFVASATARACPRDPSPANWDCFMNESIIPQEISRHHYRLLDNFHEWPRLIAERGIDPRTLLQPDMTHLSDPVGTDLMFELTIGQLCAE
jgi:hypothetical protein